MRTHTVSMSLDPQDRVTVAVVDLRGLPSVEVQVKEHLLDDAFMTIGFVRMNAEQLDRLILEATAARRELDIKEGVPQ